MTVRFSSIKSDLAKERDGEYVDIPDWPGVSLGVRSLETPAYKIALELLVARYARKYKGKPSPSDVREADVGRLLAEHILYGWKGFDEPYTPERALDSLTDPAFRDLARQTTWAAGQLAENDVEFLEDGVKNSVVPSAIT